MRLTVTVPRFVLLGAALLIVGCSAGNEGAAPATPPADAKSPDAVEEPLPPLAHESALPEEIRARLNQGFSGDLDAMVARRLIRVGVSYNRTHYFVENGVQRGIAHEYIRLMEDELNRRRRTGNLKVIFWPVPLPRDQLLSALIAGKVDMVIAQLTITPERQKLVDFTRPTREGVDEVVVTGPDAPVIASVDDLSGKQVFVRTDSSYYQSLIALNQRLKAAGKPPVIVKEAPSSLEDDDLLEMANAGLIGITIADNYLARFWKQVLPEITVHDEVAVRTGGQLAVAIRKNSPQLAAGLNAVIARHGQGSTFGNTIGKRYLADTKFVGKAASEAQRKRFLDLVNLFRKYGDRYDLDYLLMAAQGFQESGLDHSVKSPAGAIGVMQVMPATGRELAVGDIRKLEPNIHAGVKYMRFVIDTYYKDEPMTNLDKGLFAFASYNAGPARIRQLRREAEKRGLDPNVWFGNVEQIASERIGRETVTYVSNIYKYYVAYRLILEEHERRSAVKEAFQSAGDGVK